MILIRTLLLICSLLGFGFMVKKLLKIEWAFIPAFLISSITCTLIVIGIMGLSIRIAAWIIVSGGFLVGLFLLYKDLKHKTKQDDLRENMGLAILFVAGIVFMAIYTHNRVFNNWDNFSHWGLMVKLILRDGCLPNGNNNLLYHYSYPVATSVFNSFFCMITGSEKESTMMFAQGLVIISFLCPIWVLLKKKWTSAVMIVLAFFAGGFFINPLTNLYVDSLLAVCTGGIMSICFYYKNDKRIYGIVPMCMFLISVKNSGWFFFAFIIAFTIVFTKYKKIKHIIKIVLPCVFMQIIWRIHIAIAYSGVNTTAVHDMSVSNYYETLHDKNRDTILTILKNFVKRFFTITNYEFIPYIIIALLVVMAVILYKKKNGNFAIIKKLIILSVVTVITYLAFLYLTYIISMKGSESLNLASYDRYYKTVLILLMYILVLGFSVFENSITTGKALTVGKWAIIISIYSIMFCMLSNMWTYSKGKYTLEKRMKITNAVKDIDGSCTVILQGNKDLLPYAAMVTRYELLSSDVICDYNNKYNENNVDTIDNPYFVLIED